MLWLCNNGSRFGDMERQDIVLRGIERNVQMPGVNDGGLLELRGMNYRGNDIVLSAELRVLDISFSAGEELLYVHKTDGYCNYIVYDIENKILKYRVKGDSNNVDISEDKIEYPTHIGSLINILYVMTTSGILYYLYNSDGYRLIRRSAKMELTIAQKWYERNINDDGEVSDVPIRAISERADFVPVKDMGYSDIAAGTSGNKINIFKNKYNIEQITNLFGGLADNMRNEAADKNVLVDSYLIRYGLRLYDGSYLYVSPPVLLRGEEYEMITTSAIFNDEGSKKWDKFQGNYVATKGYRIELDVSKTDIIDEMQMGIVAYIDIFMTLPIPEYDSERKINATLYSKQIGGEEGKTEYYTVRWGSSYESSVENIKDYINFYRVASYNIDDIEEAQKENRNIEIDLRSIIEHISQQPILDNSVSVHNYRSNGGIVYNGRLHIYDYYEKLYNGLNLQDYLYALYSIADDVALIEGDSYYYSFIITRFNVDGIYYEIKSEVQDIASGVLSSYLSYPDARATGMTIVTRAINGDGEVSYYKKEYLLSPHPMRDEAYYFAGFETDRINLIEESNRIDEVEYLALYNKDYSNNTLYQSNQIKVSLLNNPQLFDNRHTYQVGTGTVISLNTATQAISTGQFGEFPMYVFCSDGIYAMMLGGGDVLYSNIVPFSRDVVINKNMVLNIDRAIIFGTRQGLFLLRGGDVVSIGDGLDMRAGRIEDNRTSSIINVVKALVGEDIMKIRSLEHILQNGKICYNYSRNEVYLYEPNINVVYAHSLTNGTWSSRSWSIRYIVNDYPNLLLVNSDNEVCEVADDDDYSIISDEVLVVTQPMSMGDVMNYKKLHRLHLLSNIVGNDEEQQRARLHVGVAVSNDGETWRVAWEREMEMSDAHNLRIAHVGGSWRYYTLIIHGKGMGVRSYMRGVVADYDVKMVER